MGPQRVLPNVPSGTVTFLFTDIEGSTRLLETLREQYSAVLSGHRDIIRAAFARWNGHEIDTLGDSFFVAFHRATDAIQCVMEAQHALAAAEWPIEATVRVRMGLHTGEAVITQDGPSSPPREDLAAGEKGRPYYIGMDVHRAARIASAGHGGQVLLSQTTRDLVYQDLPEGASIKDLGAYQLKDIRLPQRIYQLNIAGLPDQFPPLKTPPLETEAPNLEDYKPLIPVIQDEVKSYQNLLKKWREQDLNLLDKASLVMMLGAPEALLFDQGDLVLLMRSSLAKQMALDPWLNRSASSQAAVAALGALLEEYPPPRSRQAIVEGLCTIEDSLATQLLLRVAASDDAHSVRSRAAVEAASRGQQVQVAQELARQASQKGDPAAIAALVAVIDEFGMPAEAGEYPKAQVRLGLAQRRWMHGHESVRRRAAQGAIGGGLAIGLLGGAAPLMALLFNPAALQNNVNLVSGTAWSLSGAIAGATWGGLQGLASCTAVCLADIFRPARHPGVWRFIAGGLAGLVSSVLFILFALSGLLDPSASPGVFVPLYLAYGFLLGGALSWAIPLPGIRVPWSSLVVRVLGASLFIILVAIPAVILIYQERSLVRLPIDGLFAILMSAGLALATRKG